MTYHDDYRAKQRAKALKRQESMEKDGPPVTHPNGVVTTKQPMEWHYAGHDGIHYDQKWKSLYKVEIDGIHRGWIMSHTGWGSEWSLLKVGEDGETNLMKWSRDVVKTIDASKLNVKGLDHLVSLVLDLIASGELGTPEEQKERIRLAREREAEKHAAESAKRADGQREIYAREVGREADQADRVAALQSILDKATLSNLEHSVLVDVIEKETEILTRLRNWIEGHQGWKDATTDQGGYYT